MSVELIKADYQNPEQGKDIMMMFESYASDPISGGVPLDEMVKSNLISELSKLPYAFSIIAYVNKKPAGLANCFEVFSTFSCKPLINIHDLVVLDGFRGNGISQKLLEKVEEIAKSKGCCKVTLEVLSNNEIAKSAYRKFGFSSYELDPDSGVALFWQKLLKTG